MDCEFFPESVLVFHWYSTGIPRSGGRKEIMDLAASGKVDFYLISSRISRQLFPADYDKIQPNFGWILS